MPEKNSFTVLFKTFDVLSVHQLYAILQIRSEIFVLEQQCLYQDMDGLDAYADHLMVFDDQQTLIGYARIFPAGITFPEVSIGRILTKEHGKGIGKIVVEQSISKALNLYGQVPIRIGAQCYATEFYKKFGFEESGEGYDEDGIPHIEMVRIP